MLSLHVIDHPHGSLPDWRNLDFAAGIRPEPTPSGMGLTLWIPGEQADGYRHWERISTVPRTEFTVEPSVIAVTATSIRAWQPIGWLFPSVVAMFAEGDKRENLVASRWCNRRTGRRATDRSTVGLDREA